MRGAVIKRWSKPRDGSKPQPRYYVKVPDRTTGKDRWLTDPATGSAFTRKTDADTFLTETLQAMNTGTWVQPSAVTLGEYAERWLALAEGRLKPSTWTSYKTKLTVHVLPTLGRVPLQDLTPDALDALYLRLLRSGKRVKGHDPAPLSARSVKYTHIIIKAMLSDAVRKGLLTRNPADFATPPTPKASSAGVAGHATWSAQQVAVFLDHTQEHRYGPIWAFLALTGCRRGEALGLRWSDVDYEARRVVLQQSIGKVGGKTVVGTLKSGSGRTVACDDGLIARLKTHRREQLEERAMMGAGFTDQGLVFANPDGSPYYPETISRSFKEQSTAANLPPIRLHDLRHTWATLALQAGVNPKVVQERLGHSSVTITLSVYSHVMPTMHDDAAGVVAGLIGAYGGENVVPLRRSVDVQ